MSVNNTKFRLTTLFLLFLQIMLTIWAVKYLREVVEFHSVSTYFDHNKTELGKCQPWDYCPGKTSTVGNCKPWEKCPH